MDIPFKPITLDDKEIITSYTMPSDYQNCDYSFSNICSWRFLYKTEYAVVDENLLIRFVIEDGKRIVYMMPMGQGDLTRSVALLEEDSLRHGHPLVILGTTPEARALLDGLMPDQFYHICDRDFYDYIYLREELATLSGKKLQSKRNHVNNFVKKYDYEYVEITPDLVKECIALEQVWYSAHRTADDIDELNDERRALIYALNHFDRLDLRGGAIRVDGKIIAFSFGAPINHNTFGVHIEKADVNYEGAFAVINKEFASHLPEQYIYINREEDLGIPGLRQAKLSYKPVILLEKCACVKKSVMEK